MKKIFLSIMLAAGLYSLAIGQQSTPSKSSSSTSKSSSTTSMNSNWEKIGEKTVNLSENHGIFNWNTDREKSINADEKYSAIKFKAIDEPVNLTNVEVQYDNGKKQDLTVNSPVKANSESKVLNLNSKEKLDKVTFNFKKDNASTKEKAKVELWGLKSGSASGMGSQGGQSGSDRRSNQSGSEHSSSQSGSYHK